MTPCQSFKRSSTAATLQDFDVRAPNGANVYTSGDCARNSESEPSVILCYVYHKIQNYVELRFLPSSTITSSW